jgi:flavin reductase (DIM6/NTAB) family NADH-FMN oxidoreductase RutF
MSVARKGKDLLKDLLLGKIRPAQRFFLGQDGAQKEVTVWLHGLGSPRDVTNHHSLACAIPLTICVAFEKGTDLASEKLRGLSLRFCERGGAHQVLGRIALRYSGVALATSGPVLYFFRVSSARSYCLPLLHLWMLHLQARYRNWRQPLPPGTIKLASLDMRAMSILFGCPRPIGLASAEESSGRNMFPLNVMGQLDDGYIGFGLKDAKSPAHLVERTRRIALSTIPMRHGDLGIKLGPNHSKKHGIEWSDLPFPTKPSPKFGTPVPEFALRVRELEVEASRTLGSHIFFVARVVADERFAEDQEWCVVHGHYQAWRLKRRASEIETSIAEDARVKRGMAAGDGLI